jgi:hypothetical protein
MVAPADAMDAVAKAVADSGNLPDEMSVIMQEADIESDDSDIDLPLLEIQLLDAVNVNISNTDLAGYREDSDGNEIGRIYLSEYEMLIEVNIWTIAEDKYDPNTLGSSLRESIYQYSSYGPDKDLLDKDGEPIDHITYLRLGDGERPDDLTNTPTSRKWSQEVELWACEEFYTDEDYIVDVEFPVDETTDNEMIEITATNE